MRSTQFDTNGYDQPIPIYILSFRNGQLIDSTSSHSHLSKLDISLGQQKFITLTLKIKMEFITLTLKIKMEWHTIKIHNTQLSG